MMTTLFNSIIPAAIAIATVFLFGCTGEIIMEKAGHLNLGIPGIMCMGTVGGCVGVRICVLMFGSHTINWFVLVLLTLIFSALFSCIGALIYAFLTVSLKCNQNVTGLALTTFGAGFADYFMTAINKSNFAGASKVIRYSLPFASNLGVFGKIFLDHGVLVYIAIAIAIVTSLILSKTRIGLSLRAIGENPATADAAGINITKYKYLAIIIGSIIAGFGGVFYVMDYVGGSWENSFTIQAFGWLAIALVIFTVWKPALAIAGSIVFGILYVVPYYTSGISFAQMKILNLLPYVVTVIVLIITSIVGRKNVQPPQSLGMSYFREER